MRLLNKAMLLLALCSVMAASHGASYWQDIEMRNLRSDQALMVNAAKGRHVRADISTIRQQLLSSDNIDVEIPLPNGEMAVYHLEHSPIAEQGLLDKFPEIRTFRGVDTNNSRNRGRFDISPAGFRGMFRHNGEVLFLDPQYVGDSQIHVAYRVKDATPLSARPADHIVYTDLLDSAARAASRNAAKGSSDGSLRTYRLAAAATGEYTAFFGGTVGGAMAAITTAINRVNEIYENDLGIRLELIANNNLIIYTNAATDPYANGGLGDLDANQSNITAVIGSANFDVGHLFGTGPGGVATLASVCDDGLKARGLTGSDDPTGDAFYIDFVAHEFGHQFGANHTFNGTSGNCGGGQRNQATAFEPGSGSTIMAYAGICNEEDLEANSDPYFHAGSIAEITAFVQNDTTGGSCATESMPANATPDASAGPDVSIPANTPFVLTGSASDADMGDTLSYVWEQMDAGTLSSSQAEWIDDGSRAIFRSIEPSNTETRYFPNLPDVLDGSLTAGEAFPTTTRNLNFRFTVRDGSGETAFENKVVSVVASAGPFEVSSPTTGAIWAAGSNIVTWDVANTNVAPVDCAEVTISLSPDNGDVFAYLLTPSPVSNDGSEPVTVPFIETTQARVMVACADNVFYNVSDSPFSVSALTVPVDTIQAAIADEGSSLDFNVTLSSTLGSPANYSFSVENETNSNSDISAVTFTNGVTNANGLLTVPSGVSSFTIQIATVVDSVAEPDETLRVYLGGISATGTISDQTSTVDDVTSPVPAVEGAQLRFSVSLTAPTTVPQTLSYTLTPVTASADDIDFLTFPVGYSWTANTISVPAGQMSFDVLLNTIDDGLPEGTEVVRLTVEGISAEGKIVDNDSLGATAPASPTPTSDREDEGSSGGSAGPFILVLMSLLLFSARRKRAL